MTVETLIFRNIRASVKKMRSFASNVKLLELHQAIQLMQLIKRKRAVQFKKVLLNAANILAQRKLLKPTIRIKSIGIDKSKVTMMPRARAKGRINFIKSQWCNVTLVMKL